MDYVYVIDCVRRLGSPWTRTQAQQRLFGLCCRIAQAGRQRLGDAYVVPSVAVYPAGAAAWVEPLVQEALNAELLAHRQRYQRAARPLKPVSPA